MQLRQLPYEVLVADDGSGPETRRLIESFQEIFPVPLIHVWHEDNGFQLARIRNRAIAKATGDYIVQVDGDVILHPNFIKDHLRLSKKGYFVVGSRGSLSKAFTEKLLHYIKLPDTSVLRRHVTNKLNTLRNFYLSNFLSNKYKVHGKYKYYAKGCNMAFWRLDAITVNGYNETMVGWGREDEELVSRFIIFGLKKQFLKMGGVVYHIWHKKAAHQNEPANLEIVYKTRAEANYRSALGLDQYK